MQRLELSGWFGLIIIIGSSLATLFLVLVLPSMVATAVWNALVYETLGGPLMGLQQGFLLWALVCVVLYGIFRPSIQVVLDEADLANMDDVDFKFGTNKAPLDKLPKKRGTGVTKPTPPQKQAEKDPRPAIEAERFFSRSSVKAEKAPAPSAHWLKWRKQQAEALQVAAEAKKQRAKEAEEKEESTPKK
jgi:hypothetical protein